MDKVLITGGSGLMGSCLLEKLSKNYVVHTVGTSKPQLVNIQHINLDLASDWDISDLPEQMDIVIHLAQSRQYRDFPDSSENVFSINTTSTLKLLNYARSANVRKFIYASSGGVYGTGKEAFTEGSPLMMDEKLGFYLGTKLCSELLVRNYSDYFDIDILRFFFVYGERQIHSMLIPRLVNSVRNGIPITLQGESGIIINPIHVDDVAEMLSKLLLIDGSHTLNIAGSQELTLREISELIGTELNHEPIFEIADSTPKNLIGDISQMIDLLGKPSLTFEQGITGLITATSN